MPHQAIGMIETRGLVALVEGTDAMLKAANVELAGPLTQVGNALVTAVVVGDVAAGRPILAIENVTGSSGANIIIGDANANRLLGNGGEANLAPLLDVTHCPVKRFGLGEHNAVRATNPRLGSTASEFEIPSAKFHLNLVGELNVRNALAVVAAALIMANIFVRRGMLVVSGIGAYLAWGAAGLVLECDGREGWAMVDGERWLDDPGSNRGVIVGDYLTLDGLDFANDQDPNFLFLNRGDGTFDDVTQGSGADVRAYGQGVAVGDYDNDGRDDVFITALEGDRLYHNEGAFKFRDVTKASGIVTNTPMQHANMPARLIRPMTMTRPNTIHQWRPTCRRLAFMAGQKSSRLSRINNAVKYSHATAR